MKKKTELLNKNQRRDKKKEKEMGNSKAKPEQSDTKETESTNPAMPTAPLYPQLQIRNCIRNVRGNNSNFSDMYPNEAGTSCGLYQLSRIYFFFLQRMNVFVLRCSC